GAGGQLREPEWLVRLQAVSRGYLFRRRLNDANRYYFELACEADGDVRAAAAVAAAGCRQWTSQWQRQKKAEAQAKLEAEAQAKLEAEAQAKLEAEAQADLEAEADVKLDASTQYDPGIAEVATETGQRKDVDAEVDEESVSCLDESALSGLRQQLHWELVWLDQAIASRRHFLRFRRLAGQAGQQ
ncbi:hypothetical protein BOX15_Mlig006780g2, partial [Macrostomum lignano]